jgi:type IV fimbrial biogenesis protein FimT
MGRNGDGMQQERGLTLVELVVTIAIAAILMAIAMPSLQSFLLNSKVRSAAGRLQEDLQMARAEAVKTNQVVALNISAANGVCAWNLAPTFSSYTPMTAARYQSEYASVSCTATASQICFDPLGTLAPGGTCALGGTFTFTPNSTGTTWLVLVNTGGRVTSCLQSAGGGCYIAP